MGVDWSVAVGAASVIVALGVLMLSLHTANGRSRALLYDKIDRAYRPQAEQ